MDNATRKVMETGNTIKRRKWINKIKEVEGKEMKNCS